MVDKVTNLVFCAPQLSRPPLIPLSLFIVFKKEDLSIQMRPTLSKPSLALSQVSLTGDVRVGGKCVLLCGTIGWRVPNCQRRAEGIVRVK